MARRTDSVKGRGCSGALAAYIPPERSQRERERERDDIGDARGLLIATPTSRVPDISEPPMQVTPAPGPLKAVCMRALFTSQTALS